MKMNVSIPKSLRNQAGFSLMELMISLPATILMAMALGVVIISMYAMSTRTITNITAEQELNLMVNTLKSVARSGINVRYTAIDLSGRGSNSNEGYVRGLFNFSSFSDLAPGAVTPIMFFARETAISDPTISNVSSDPGAAGLFFVAPTPLVPGQLQLTLAKQLDPNYVLRPCVPINGLCPGFGRPSIFLNNVVGLRMFEAQYSPTTGLMDSVKMEIVVRVFVADSSKPRMYCPSANWAASCSAGGPYRDFSRTIVLQFDNNRRESLIPGFDYPYGVYFFRPRAPRWYVN